MLEFFPKRKAAALLWSVFIHCAAAGNRLKKAAEMFAVNDPLAQGKSALHLPQVLFGKAGGIHALSSGQILQFLQADPDIAAQAPAAAASAGAAGLAVELEGKVLLIVHAVPFTFRFDSPPAA